MNTNHYKKEIDNIINYAKKNDISEEQVNKIFNECFHLLETKSSSRLKFILRFIKWLTIISFVLVSSGFVLYNHPKTHNILLRNVQNFIYPGLRIFRKFAVPVITVYPFLTGKFIIFNYGFTDLSNLYKLTCFVNYSRMV